MSAATRRALYGKLAGDVTLTTMLGSAPAGQNIHYQQAPSEANFPLVILSKQSGTPTYTLTEGTAKMDTETWLVKGVDRGGSADTVDAIASRLDALLTDGAVSISGRTQLYLRRESDVDYLETDEGQTYRHSGALYRLVHEPT